MKEPCFLPLEELVVFPYTIFAHTHKNKPKETLQEHTRLCEGYFKNIYKARELDKSLERMATVFHLEEGSIGLGLFYKMFFNMITLHDVGKLNPEFQKEVMENKLPEDFTIAGLKGSRHSLLSSVIYLNHFMNRIEESKMDREEQKILRGLCLMNGFVIAKHHSSLREFGKFLGDFRERGAADSIMQGFKKGCDFLKDMPYKRSNRYPDMWGQFCQKKQGEEGIAAYAYVRFLYSLLVSCDYYATTEFRNEVEIQEYGNDIERYKFTEIYEDADLTKKIRAYEKGMAVPEGINKLRSDIYLEVERVLKVNSEAEIYFLEAPTGSGKSNASMNLSFQLLKEGYRRIFYVYPFNTLVEQNLATLEEIFGKDSPAFKNIVVLNSNTPIKYEKSQEDESRDKNYEKALLDRQFLNYPFVLTTHVSLFEIMFSEQREAVFGFSQLQDSVIVLDEIQSYKNTIWSEIIIFLKAFAKLLNMKIIIMSATLPNLNYLTGDDVGAVKLLQNRDRYFTNPLFKERVKVSYDLLECEMNLELLLDHIAKQNLDSNKIVVEFIKKSRAYEFVDMLAKDIRIRVPIYFVSGDDNRADRATKLKDIKGGRHQGLILVATQVIEAGVDIDMDIGYKDISKLDSEEQFLGRINRSCKRNGIVYFFQMDDAKKIYSDGDYRMNTEFTLLNEEMREVLMEKNFDSYYGKVMNLLKCDLNHSRNDVENLELFFDEAVKGLDFSNVADRMKLIRDSDWDMPVYLAQNIMIEAESVSGSAVWEEYRKLLMDHALPYAEKQVRLSNIRSKMNYFIYQIKKTSQLSYSDRIGDLYYIEDGEQYFKDGRLDKDALENGGSMFLDI